MDLDLKNLTHLGEWYLWECAIWCSFIKFEGDCALVEVWPVLSAIVYIIVDYTRFVYIPFHNFSISFPRLGKKNYNCVRLYLVACVRLVTSGILNNELGFYFENNDNWSGPAICFMSHVCRCMYVCLMSYITASWYATFGSKRNWNRKPKYKDTKKVSSSCCS